MHGKSPCPESEPENKHLKAAQGRVRRNEKTIPEEAISKGGTQKQGQRQKPKTDKRNMTGENYPAARQKQQVTVSKPQRTDKQKVQAPAAPEKKPLLKRLLGRIFG